MALTPYPMLRLKLQQPQSLKMRFLPSFGGTLTAISPLTVVQHGNNYVISIDVDELVDMLTSVVNIEFIIDGGGLPITTGIKGDLEVSFGGTIMAATLLADQVGSIVVDIWNDTYGAFPPTVADSITAAAKPTLSAASKYQDTLLTGWNRTITPGNTLRFNVDSASTVQRVTLSLHVLKDWSV